MNNLKDVISFHATLIIIVTMGVIFINETNETSETNIIVIVVECPEIKDVDEKDANEKKETVVKKVETKVKSEEKEVKPKNEKNENSKVDDNTYLLAQLINAEAKGEPYKGKIAVGNVVLNRVESNSLPDTIEGVIFQKGQFSPVSNGSIYNKPSSEALKAAQEVMNGTNVVGDEVLYFYNPDITTSSWIFTRDVVTKIGNHAFAL